MLTTIDINDILTKIIIDLINKSSEYNAIPSNDSRRLNLARNDIVQLLKNIDMVINYVVVNNRNDILKSKLFQILKTLKFNLANKIKNISIANARNWTQCECPQ